jgi:hypothetical protein
VPVLKPTAPSETVAAVRQVLATGLAAKLPALDLVARKQAASKAQCAGLPQALYLLLSAEDGGYARQGFYVAEASGQTTLCQDHFIDLTADAASIASGEFEEVLAHEWGHVLLRRMLGPVPPTPSRKFHSVRTMTDPTTGFDEGFGIHFQPLSAKLSTTPGYRARIDGAASPRLADLWFSRQETWMRQALVPANRFVFEKHSPVSAADPYRRWLADEAASDFDTCRLKSGDQMVASEGVAASFFHRLMAGAPGTVDTRYGKVIAVLARLGGWPSNEPAIVAFVRAWGEEFPAERDAVQKLFLDVTHGATASVAARAQSERVACAGASGDIEAFLGARKTAQEARDKLAADVLAGRVSLTSALGPQLWIANAAVQVPAAPWQGKRELPAVTDLNTAREAELELIFAGTTLAGTGARLIEARRAGPFASFEDAARRALLGDSGLGVLSAARDQALKVGAAVRH